MILSAEINFPVHCSLGNVLENIALGTVFLVQILDTHPCVENIGNIPAMMQIADRHKQNVNTLVVETGDKTLTKILKISIQSMR